MLETQPFNGLTMPVFSAFGWAGEAQAMKFALSQLELFIARLHENLPADLRAIFPYAGLDRATNLIYLAANEEIEKDIYVTFLARPLSFQIALNVTDKKLLAKSFKRADTSAKQWYQIFARLEPGWEMHLRQMEVTDEENPTSRAFYKDLFKDMLSAFSIEAAETILTNTAYLNGEPGWVTPLTVSQKFSSDQISIMGAKVIRFISQKLETLLPVIRLFNQQQPKQPAQKSKVSRSASPTAHSPEQIAAMLPHQGEPMAEFTYVAEVKPLHIRKGFINLTPEHWAFFALTARTETREVKVRCGDKLDSKSSVWRLAPNNQARIVLSEVGQQWLQKQLVSEGRVEIIAHKNEQNEILLTVRKVENKEK